MGRLGEKVERLNPFEIIGSLRTEQRQIPRQRRQLATHINNALRVESMKAIPVTSPRQLFKQQAKTIKHQGINSTKRL